MVDELSLPLSALQHWLFCPRQAALIHVERLWEENRLTAEGRLLHAVADSGEKETRGTMLTLRSVQIASKKLQCHGVADVVEMQGAVPFPVEYKRGHPKAHRADEVQLCAQALCLEEMLETYIPCGAIFYGVKRRRQSVSFDTELRDLTQRIAQEAQASLWQNLLPDPVYDPAKCEGCSMKDLCRPESPRSNASSWFRTRLLHQKVPE